MASPLEFLIHGKFELLCFGVLLMLVYFRLVAGPMVVGITGALYRRCETSVEADLVWQAALDDGLVGSLTLVTPLPSAYLDLSCDTL